VNPNQEPEEETVNHNYDEDPWYNGDLLEEPLATPSRFDNEPLYKTLTGWFVAIGTGILVVVVLLMAIAVGRDLL